MRKKTCIPLIAGALVLAMLMSGCSAPPLAAAAEKPQHKESQTNLTKRASAAKKEVEENTPEEPVKTSEPEAEPAYDFSQPVPESEPVDNSYFEDAAFVGDSRTDGFMIYSGIGCGETLTSNGLSIFKLAEKKAITIDGTKYTLLEALGLKQYGKVYLSLGVNELGYYNDQGFYEAYCQAIDLIRQSQPNAVIYIQSILPVSAEKSAGDDIYSNPRIDEFNGLLRELAEEKEVYYVNVAEAVAGEDGCLPEGASFDGVHLTPDYCAKWRDYLKTHTVIVESAE